MAYSGGQIQHAFDTYHTATAEQFGIPIVPYVTGEARIRTEEYVRWDLCPPAVVVQRPVDRLVEMFPEMRADLSWYKPLPGAPAGNVQTHDGRYMLQNTGQDTNHKCVLSRHQYEAHTNEELLTKLRYFFALTQEDKVNPEVLAALWTYYRITKILKPVVLFEHKVADIVSVSTRLLQTYGHDPAPLVVFRHRAHSARLPAGDLAVGSVGFYMRLAWLPLEEEKEAPVPLYKRLASWLQPEQDAFY